MNKINKQSFSMAGLFTLSLRLVVGWTYFSAFWRRLILKDKLDPELPGYIGEKFNHFLPNALGIKPIIQFLVENPDHLWFAMMSFTIIEGIVGLFIMFGLFTRAMSVGVFGLAMGILLGSGWIGTTCLDEWQIGVLGIATGFTLFLSGSGYFSFDQYLMKKEFRITKWRYWNWIGSGSLPINLAVYKRIGLVGAFIILFITLYTNQYFHGGLWGTLHNKSVKPKVEIYEASIKESSLVFDVYRVEGVDVYGSFLISASLKDSNENDIYRINGEALAALKKDQIKNYYIAKVKPGKHSLIIPLGAKATINLNDNKFNQLSKGKYTLTLTDVSGIFWEKEIIIK
ncbi:MULTISPECIES: TQO small subunit DoxD [Galbibacter]|uniref:TQO small subunit DoxD n=1 Tax=Galbibacter orientalis DSM 19592 TaxID=926559 RepID=I3C9H0_9FLAO|nr:TQO small subunit DoxD [Galbibacter orientalis]EIJ40263.1 TQO small subunit DoxD [Galbibacter orientalis DSM 19592]